MNHNFMQFVVSEEYPDEMQPEGAGGQEEDSTFDGSGDEATTAVPADGWLRDLSEDDAYNTLQAAKQFPDHLRSLESRLSGRFGPVQETLTNLQKSLGSRVNLDLAGVKEVLTDYDSVLADKLVPALEKALTVAPLDEQTLSPFLQPMQEQMAKQMGEQLVLSQYDAETIKSIIPAVGQDGSWTPESQRQKDFAAWYKQQPYEVQGALENFGSNWVQAMRKFEKWESTQLKDREKRAGVQSSRMAAGQPASRGRRPGTAGPQTDEEQFLAEFEKALNG